MHNRLTKEVLEACLLSEDFSYNTCEEITGMPETIIEAYKDYFFDTSVFRYKMQKYDYVQEYENEDINKGKAFYEKFRFKLVGRVKDYEREGVDMIA